MSDALLELYLEGKKTAGSGLLMDYEKDGEDLPAVGDHWIILNSKGQPRCIVRTTRVELLLFKDVTQEIAIAEGEGDLSLAYWRQAHRFFFEPYLEGLGIDDLDEAMVTEFYDVVTMG